MAEPTRSDVALRIAVAGNRKLGPEPGVYARLQTVFAAIEVALAEAVGGSGQAPPVLRLVSGLADGADQLASAVFLAGRTKRVRRSIAAVLPFDIATYRDRSPVEDKASFEELLGHCDYVVELDGRFDDSATSETSAAERAIAYRKQSETLLSRADILLAIEDPNAQGRAGGTRETIERALTASIPVVYLPLRDDSIAVLRTPADLAFSKQPPHLAAAPVPPPSEMGEGDHAQHGGGGGGTAPGLQPPDPMATVCSEEEPEWRHDLAAIVAAVIAHAVRHPEGAA
jgi:hypothetical protein